MASADSPRIAAGDVAAQSAALAVDRTSPQPLWVQVGADVRRRCASGGFAAGVPGELVLGREYGVSRHTIREALRSLRGEGTIRSQRGRGSVVAPTLEAPFTEVVDVSAGADDDAAVLLGLPAGTLLRITRRTHRLDDRVVAVEARWEREDRVETP